MKHEDALTQQIWDSLLDTDRSIRYCDQLASRSLFRHRLLSGGMVAASAGVATPLLSPLPEFVAAIFFAGVVVIGIWSLLADYATRAAVSRSLCERYQELKIEWKNLWYQGANQAEVNVLSNKLHQISRNVNIPHDKDLDQKTTEETYSVLPFEFRLETQQQ